jgi:hypothetical protein
LARDLRLQRTGELTLNGAGRACVCGLNARGDRRWSATRCRLIRSRGKSHGESKTRIRHGALDEVHADDKVWEVESAALLSVRKIPVDVRHWHNDK